MKATRARKQSRYAALSELNARILRERGKPGLDRENALESDYRGACDLQSISVAKCRTEKGGIGEPRRRLLY